MDVHVSMGMDMNIMDIMDILDLLLLLLLLFSVWNLAVGWLVGWVRLDWIWIAALQHALGVA